MQHVEKYGIMGLLWAGLPPEGLVFGCGGRKKSGHIKKGGEARMELSEVFDKKLGFGCLRLPHHGDDASDVDVEQMKQMVDLFLERGFRYFDTAYSYLDYKSELFVRETLTGRHPREAFVLTTKLPCLELTPDDSPEKLQGMVKEQLQKCGVDYFDFYFLHSLDAGHLDLVERLGCFELLKGLKREGKTRFCGFSFHDTADVLDRILTRHPEVDVVQIQLNYLDWEHPVIQSRACLEVCRRHGKPVIVMEPVKGGTLAALPKAAQELLEQAAPGASPASWAIRFAASQPGVAMVLSGMSDLQQVEDNTSFMRDFVPLDGSEKEVLRQAARIVGEAVAVPCTGCSYCTKGCPMQIPIPRYFTLFNQHKRDRWQANAKERYAEMLKTHAPASACVECRQCEQSCPQHLEICGWLKEVAQAFEGSRG